MKGSSISVRIADFLKAYPPFEYLPFEDLLTLAENGKVKFHEDGEFVFAKGQPRDQWLYVIQQGSVRILEGEGEGGSLVDLRGAGDILGLHGIRTEEPYLHTCITETETILYGLPRKMFVGIAAASARAKRYLAAYFSVSPLYKWGGGGDEDPTAVPEPSLVTLRKGGLLEVDPPHEVARTNLVTVPGEASVREVAHKLQSKRVPCVLIVDSENRPLGKLTDADLRDRLREGAIDPRSPARDLMFTDLVPASPTETTGDLLIKLTRHGKKFLVVTEDGTLGSTVRGLVSERNLFLQYGRFPTVIGDAIASAPDVGSIRVLRDRLEALILEFLENRDALKWLMEMVGILNRKLFKRLTELVLSEMERDGFGEPPLRYSWLMMGSGGRDELLIRSAVYHALVYEDPPEEAASETERFFREMARRVAGAIRQCGFLESPQNVLAQYPPWCLPIGKMKDRFTELIEDPVRNHVYSARDAFDFQPVREAGCPLAAELGRHVEHTLRSNPAFIRHMASDSLVNQPPRTIFSGYVVDQAGIRKENLSIKSHALLPLVDVARVYALEAGVRHPTSTYKRLEAIASRSDLPDEVRNLFHEASEGFLVAQYARISKGLRRGTDGAVIQPSGLDSEIRTLLITTFRTIFKVLEATAERFGANWRG